MMGASTKSSRSKSGKPGGSKPEITIIDIVEQQKKDAEANLRRVSAKSMWGTASEAQRQPSEGPSLLDSVSPAWKSYKGPALDNAAPEVTSTPEPSHTVEGVTSVISTLQSLEETLPGIVHAANALGGRGFNATPYRTTADLGVAVHMLREYRRRIDDEILRRADEQASHAIQTAYEVGVQAGIDQEKARAKEARSARRR